MNQFEDFVRFLKESGVSKFAIEFAQPVAPAVWAGADLGKPDSEKTAVQVVHREPENVLVPVVEMPGTLLPMSMPGTRRVHTEAPAKEPELTTAVKVTDKAMAEIEKADVATEPQKPVEKTVEQQPEAAPEIKSKKKEPLTSAPTKPESNCPEIMTYEQFLAIVEKDNGTPEHAELKRDALRHMALDGLLQVNADFQLGHDTDVPTESLREVIVASF